MRGECLTATSSGRKIWCREHQNPAYLPCLPHEAVSCASSLISLISLHFASLCMVTASLTDRCMAASWPAACQPLLSRALLSVDCCLLPNVSWKSSTVVCYLLSVFVCCSLSIALLPAVSCTSSSIVFCLLSVVDFLLPAVCSTSSSIVCCLLSVACSLTSVYFQCRPGTTRCSPSGHMKNGTGWIVLSLQKTCFAGYWSKL